MKDKNDLNFNSKLNSKERFGLRKLSIGLAAVCLGTSFILLNNQTAYAADKNQAQKNVENISKSNTNSVEKTDNEGATESNLKQLLQEKQPSKANSQLEETSNQVLQNNNQQTNPQVSNKSNIENAHNNQESEKVTTSLSLNESTSFETSPKNQATTNQSSIAKAKSSEFTNTDISNSKNITITSSNTSDMMANSTSGHVLIHVKNAGIYTTNSNATVTISNPDNLLSFSNNAPVLGNDFSTSTNGEGTFTFTYIGKVTSTFDDLNLDLAITGNNDAVKTYMYHHNNQYPTNIPISVSVTLPQTSAFTQTFTTTIKPYADKVQSDELMHGFIMGPKVVWSPESSNNTRTVNGQEQIQVGINNNGSPVFVNKGTGKVENGFYVENGVSYSGPELCAIPDLSTEVKQDSARLMQYGIDWNFGELNPLDNVLATISVSEGQVILPSTIKVFHITNPADIKTTDNTRIPIDESYNNIVGYNPTTGKFDNEDPNFEKFLRDHLSTNGQNIRIDQTGPFTINNENYSKKGAYFIQFDANLNLQYLPNWQVTGNGPSITTPIHNERNWNTEGQGNNTTTQTFTGFNKGYVNPGNAVNESINVHYIDENTGKQIQAPSIYTGKADGTISNHTLLNIKNIENNNYIFDKVATMGGVPHITLPKNTYDPSYQNFGFSNENTKNNAPVNIYNAPNLGFSNDPNSKALNYYVYFYQAQTPTSRTITVTQNITYIYGNGPQAGKEASSPISKKLSFTNNGVIRNGVITWDKNWSVNTGTLFGFSKIASPEIANYTPNIKQIDTIKISNQELTNAANSNQPISFNSIVEYYTNEYATLSFYDDTDNISLSNFLIKNNQSATLSDSYTKQDNNSEYTPIKFNGANNIVKFLESKGYRFVKVTGLGSNSATQYNQVSYGNFDNDPDHDQAFVLHFVHETKPVSQSKTVNETINYIYTNGPKEGQEAAPTYKAAPIKFTQHGTQDLVTGNTKWDAWTPASDQFKEVVSPKIDHYTTDKLQIETQTVTPKSKDLSYVVYYSMIEEPDKPNTPDKPSTPEKPSRPTQPTAPTEPQIPEKPVQPITPGTPSTPQPSTPDKPSAPQPSNPDSNNVPQPQHQPKRPNKPAKTTISVPHSSSKPTSAFHQSIQKNAKNITLHNNSTLTKTTITTHPHFAKALPTSHINSTLIATQSNRILPQTGEKENSLTILGLALATLAGILGLSIKKHKN
ncbi:mucin-binding protein [Lactobacillus intestinalis]|uniref:mucin-binding protein n=1 Tax=Lactobacillus intestinalis TaxID=151781 RepID=UPI001F59AB26|nr:LPXTG cell wall anchor domain-containing protein [Lactobacillus intestinalis]